MGHSVGFGAVVLVLHLVALVFLILATILSPVVLSFALGAAGDYQFGVFGYCRGGACVTSYPWTPSGVRDGADWAMSGSSRDTLAKILILCPIAAGIVLISLVLLVVALFALQAFAVVSIVATILGFAITAIACISTVMLFYPNLEWAGWILIGAAAAMLVAIPLVILAVKFGHYSDARATDDDSLDAFDRVAPEPKFDYVPPARQFDDESSRDFGYKQDSFVRTRPVNANTTLDSSLLLYNANPQRTHDFTAHAKPSNGSLHGDDTRVSLVNGPNTPVSAQRNMAPNLVPTVATPTINDAPLLRVPAVPYPVYRPAVGQAVAGQTASRPGASATQSGPGSGQPGQPGALPYHRTVFEHHPEVEGHRPFTEMDDQPDRHQLDLVDCDNESDFTSVSQRAPNPQYYSQNVAPQPQPFVPQYGGNSHYSDYGHASPAPAPPPGNHYSQPRPYQGPPQQYQQGPLQQSYQPPQQYQQPFAGPRPQPHPRGPTISDNALSNNPDFALGGGKKPMRLPMGPAFAQSPYNAARAQRPPRGTGASGMRDGPYAFR